MGKNTTKSVKGSLEGVITAASINNITMACFLNLVKNDRFRMPIFDKSHDKSGNSNTKPIMKHSIKKLSIYESSDTLFSIYELS